MQYDSKFLWRARDCSATKKAFLFPAPGAQSLPSLRERQRRSAKRRRLADNLSMRSLISGIFGKAITLSLASCFLSLTPRAYAFGSTIFTFVPLDSTDSILIEPSCL